MVSRQWKTYFPKGQEAVQGFFFLLWLFRSPPQAHTEKGPKYQCREKALVKALAPQNVKKLMCHPQYSNTRQRKRCHTCWLTPPHPASPRWPCGRTCLCLYRSRQATMCVDIMAQDLLAAERQTQGFMHHITAFSLGQVHLQCRIMEFSY